MFRISTQGIGTAIQSPLSSIDKPGNYFEWDISLYYKDGGKKRTWYLGQDNSPLHNMSFELNEHICGSGSMEFSYLDFPIDADDYIVVRYKGQNVYRALIDNTVDPKGGKIKLEPFHIRFREILINDTFTTATIEYILESIITDNQDETKIQWLDGFIDIDDTDTYTLDYSGYDNIKKIIDELVKKLDDRYWGTDANNIFRVYTPDSVVTEDYFYTLDPKYTEINVKTNWSKIKATRYQVFKKVIAGGESERIGEVGYGGSYPAVDAEDFLRTKEAKFNVSEYIASDSEALDIAYQNLVVETETPQNIKVKNFDINELLDSVGTNPIGKLIKVQDREEIILRTIINCNALTNDDTSTTIYDSGAWSGATIDTSDFVDGSGSITFSSGSIVYDLGNIISFKEPTRIGFMIKSTIAGNYLEMSTGQEINGWGAGTWGLGAWGINTFGSDDLWNTTREINIPTGSVWTFIDVPIIDTELRYFGIRFTDSTSATINVDRIQMYLPARSEYEQNIIKASFVIQNDLLNTSVDMNKYALQANDLLFIADKKIDKLEAIAQQT